MIQTSTPLTPEQLEDWTELCLREFPNEACAYIVNDRIYPLRNISNTPTETFVVDPIDRIKAESLGHVSGFLHSHPATPMQAAQRKWPTHWPTSHDMRSWLADNVRWGISACDGEFVAEPVWMDESYVAPLEGRPFIHGIWDCYSAVRDYFRVNKGVTLKNYPRGMEWWAMGGDLYTENFQNAGFRLLEGEQPLPGDCALMTIHSRGVICHAAVVHDQDTIFHHTFSRSGTALSRYESLHRWDKFIAKYVRYAGAVNTPTQEPNNTNDIADHPPTRRRRRKVHKRTH